MPSNTAARSGARSSRSKAGSRSGSRPARPAPRRKPARHRNVSRIPAAGLAIGRGARAGWLMLARGAGSTARSVGRARDIDPGHRRDAIARALLGVAVIVVASSGFDAARPVGGWIDNFLRVLIGSAVLLLPLALVAIAVALMRSEPDPDARPRLILGAAMITLPALGLSHLWAGSPDTPPGRQHAAGFIGFALGGPRSEGRTQWIAAPLLFIGVLCLSPSACPDGPPWRARAQVASAVSGAGGSRCGASQVGTPPRRRKSRPASARRRAAASGSGSVSARAMRAGAEIGRASCRDRVL